MTKKLSASLPDCIHVGPLSYKVTSEPHIAAEDGHYGECNHRRLTISIDSGAHPDRQRQTLVHESLEAINDQYSVGLSHDQIERLEGPLFALYSDNHGIFS